MNRRRTIGAMVGLGLALCEIQELSAQSSAKVIVIGLLDGGERLEWWEAFRQQLRELGYAEGRNVRFERRYAKGNLDTLPALAKELVQANVAVIVTGGAAASVAARRATRQIPIVMATGADPVSLGLAANLARPGGNVTGLTSLNSDLMVKRFELLREAVPKSSRLAVLWHADNTPSMASIRELEAYAAQSRLSLHSLGIRSTEEVADAFTAMTKERIDALMVVGSPFVFGERTKIAQLAEKNRIPAMYGGSEYVDAGGLMSYAPSYTDLFRRAAIYVDKILKGAPPGDLPIEQPTTFELVINGKTAQALGIHIPSSIMARASRVIQ